MLKEYLLLFLAVLACNSFATGQMLAHGLPSLIDMHKVGKCREVCRKTEKEDKGRVCPPGVKYCVEKHFVKGECVVKGTGEKETMPQSRCRKACEKTEKEIKDVAVCGAELTCCKEKSYWDYTKEFFSTGFPKVFQKK